MPDIEAIYQEYFPSVYRYVCSLCRDEVTAGDITNETFLKALKGIDHFKGDCDIKVWLCQIAKNTYFSSRKIAKESVPLDAAEGVENPGRAFTEKQTDREAAFEVYHCLHRLSEPYKEVFSLRVFAELSFADIADLFGKTEGWARVTYHRAKLKLKEAVS